VPLSTNFANTPSAPPPPHFFLRLGSTLSDIVSMKWFILQSARVEGPFTTEILKRKIDSGEITEECQIWGPLQTGWKSLAWWTQSLPHLKAIKADLQIENQWFYVNHGKRMGPVSREELVNQLKTFTKDQESAARALVWTRGFKKWTPVMELHDLMNDLGIDLRKHPRARAQGKVTVILNNQTYISSLKSISEGGLGLEPIPMLYPGEEVQIRIESADFGGEISAKAEIRYVNEKNMGLQFKALNSENKANIVTYIKTKMDMMSQNRAA